MKNFFTNLHYKSKTTLLEKILLSMLLPVSVTYYSIAEIRNFLYKVNLFKVYNPEVLTISIGNLTTGGTGKTPITAALANCLTKKGYKVAILSRGYGSKLNSKEINVISDGDKIYYDAQMGGDEPVWLAQNCPDVAVLTSSNRVQIAKHAQKMGCNALILDDGFQHQKLGRNINVAVVDVEKQFGNKKVLPAGPLREALKNIKRADKVVVVNKSLELVDDVKFTALIKLLKNLNEKVEISLCNAKVDKIYEIHSTSVLEKPEGVKALAFSAIGQPSQFYNLLEQVNMELVKTIDFADHHKYSSQDVECLLETANTSSADVLVTTEKDAVKVKNLTQKAIYALKLGIDWDAETIL